MDKRTALAALAALAHDTRLEAFRLLVKAGPDGIPAGAIAESLGVRQNTMSSHLGILARAGLIVKCRDGRVIRYGADYGHMQNLLLYLLEDCCQGSEEICAPVLDAARCTVRSK